jgi:phosphoribosylglycinamide formyltransferase-1
VLADRECFALDFAARKNIFSKKIKYNRELTAELQAELDLLKPDLIVTNIHKIIDKKTLSRFPQKFINLHYSLLPAFAGLIGMETALKAKEQNAGFMGGTCHLVNEEVDSGRILQQGCYAVDWNDDKDVIDTLFKISCICLLGGIMMKLEINKGNSDRLIINNREAYFSPALMFGDVFEEEFWDTVKNGN